MGHRFGKHYTRDDARAMLPQVQTWLRQLKTLRQRLAHYDQRLDQMLGHGNDLGGATVNDYIRTLCDAQGVLREFQQREIQVKDPDKGLIDFPALVGGREVFLCWEQGEEDIEFWHELDAGYAGRERLP